MHTAAILRVEGEPRCVADARHLVGERCAGVATPTEVEAIQLMVSELVTNVIRHTPTGEGELRLLLDSDAVRIEVEDHGTGIPERPVEPDRQGGGGFGLFVVDRLADRWGVHQGNCIWFELDRQPSRSEKADGHPQSMRFHRRGDKAAGHSDHRRLTAAEAPARR